jgi:hypothetical protein
MSRAFVLLPLLSACCICHGPSHEADPVGVGDCDTVVVEATFVSEVTCFDAPPASHVAAPETRRAEGGRAPERNRAARRTEPAADPARHVRERPAESRGRPADDARAARRDARRSRRQD